MNQKQVWSVAFLALITISGISISRVENLFAQQDGEDVFGGGGFGGGGGGGGGGGWGQPNVSGALSAFGEYVYVLRQGTLYQYAAYDLKLIKKGKPGEADGNRQTRRRRAVNRGGGGFGGGGGGGRGGDGGQGGTGGYGGGFVYGGTGAGRSDDVAAYGDYVYVLENNVLHKLASDGLATEETVTLDFDDQE